MVLHQHFKIIISVVAVILITCLAILLYFVFRPNPYCDPSLCGKGQKHIGCYGNDWGPTCDDPDNIDITDDLISLIVDLHNEYRNDVAKGTLQTSSGGTLPMAARMGVVAWDDELAYLAKLNTYQCEMKHDQCRNTEEFKFSGQNLGFAIPFSSPQNMIKSTIKNWFNEYLLLTNIDEITSAFTGKTKGIGHFTALAQDKQTNVGCGMTTSLKKKKTAVYFACNYSYTNIVGASVYKESKDKVPCHGCKKGCHPKYKYLCAAGEDIKPR